MAVPVKQPPLWRTVRESWSEAEFLWGRWEAALDSHRHTLDDVTVWVEERLLGACEGVALGGKRAVQELLAQALTGRRPRAATVAAYILASMGRAGDEALLDALSVVSLPRAEQIARGMELANDVGAPARWLARAAGCSPEAQAAIVRVYAFRGLPAPAGMDRIVNDNAAPCVQLRCIELAATARAPWAQAYIEWGLGRSCPEMRIAAAKAGMTAGLRRARHTARDLVVAGVAGADVLLPGLALAYGERALPLVLSWLGRGAPTRPVCDALTAIGTVRAGDVCAELLRRESEPELVADALRSIIGPEADGTFTDSDDDSLPRPDAARLLATWARVRTTFHGGARYFDGQPLCPDRLRSALRTTRTRFRHLLAAELCLRTGGAGRIATTAWTDVQRAQMATSVALAA